MGTVGCLQAHRWKNTERKRHTCHIYIYIHIYTYPTYIHMCVYMIIIID